MQYRDPEPGGLLLHIRQWEETRDNGRAPWGILLEIIIVGATSSRDLMTGAEFPEIINYISLCDSQWEGGIRRYTW